MLAKAYYGALVRAGRNYDRGIGSELKESSSCSCHTMNKVQRIYEQVDHVSKAYLYLDS